MKPVTTIKDKPHKKNRSYNRVTIILPAGSKFPTIRGKWEKLADGKIRAWYTPEEHEKCRQMFKAIKDMDSRTRSQ